MRRNSFLLVIGFLFLWGLLSSFDYAGEWGTVRDLMQSQPKSALEKINAIEKRAKREKNAPQEIACILQRGVARSFIDDSSFVDCLAELKKYRQKTKDEVARSVATYMIGNLYHSYYKEHYYKVGRRMDIDYVPEDISEWPSNLFCDSIHDNWYTAIANEKLKTVPSLQYESLLKLGEDSRIYRPTLYDLFVSNMLDDDYPIISSEEKEKLLTEWVAAHANDKERDAYVNAKLAWLKFKSKHDKDQNLHVSRLESLLEEVKDHRASILVRIDLCDALEKNIRLRDLPADSKLPQRLRDICDEGINSYPNHEKISSLHRVLEELYRPYISVRVNNNVKLYTTDTVQVRVSYANMEQLKLNLSRLDLSSSIDYHTLYDCCDGRSSKNELKCADIKTIPLRSFLFDLSKTNYCILQDTVLSLSTFDFGLYRLSVDTVSSFVDFEVSNLFYLQTQDPISLKIKDEDDDEFYKKKIFKISYVLMDAKSGAPKSDVGLNLKRRKYNSEKTYEAIKQQTTDQFGFATFELSPTFDSYECKMFFKDGEDQFLSPDEFSVPSSDWAYSRKIKIRDSKDGNKKIAIFTDRSIYRPSQTVYYKAILYRLNDKGCGVKADKKVTVSLIDANYQTVAEHELKTNAYGSVDSSFVIPQGAITGSYSIEVSSSLYESNEVSFCVEEYKRPTFEVKLTRPTESFSFGDSIKVKGQVDYLLGAPLSGVKVKCRVVATPCYRWHYWSNYYKDVLLEKEFETSDDGSFVVPFLALKDEKDKEDKESISFREYTVIAKVTDANGETHEEKISVVVGDRSLIISDSRGSCYNILMSLFPKINHRVANLYGVGQEVPVSYEVFRDGELVASGSVKSDEDGEFSIPEDTKSWLPGRYELMLKAMDSKGREVTASHCMVLFREDDKRPPVYSILWHENMDFDIVNLPYGKKYKVRVGSSLTNAHLLMIVTDEYGEVERRWIHLNDEIKNFSFSLKEKNGQNLNVKFFLVHEGQLYRKEITLKKQRENKAMPVKLSVFRNKMLPGSKETWTLSLPKGKRAEVLASMYDASLDKIVPNSHWEFTPVYLRWFDFPKWDKCEWLEKSLSLDFYKPFNVVPWSFDHFMILPNGSKNFPYFYMAIASGNMKKSDLTGAVSTVSSSRLTSTSSEFYDVRDGAKKKKKKETNPSQLVENLEVKNVRKNFSETAFFYPHLYTDRKGNVQFIFEMPESLTRWNFRALAHTKDLFYGQMFAQMVTQKEFMISPNLPRFLRKGDRCVLSAKVINLSESNVNGTALMEFLDPVTEKVVAKAKADFSLEARKNTVVTWTFDVPRDRDAVLVRTSAVADNFSDAEQSLLPILSDRTVLTQSLPLYVRGGQTKNYTFENLVNNHSTTLSSRFLKLEFAKDPIWYAVQALPSVATVEWENAVSYSAAHFAALLSKHLALSNPKIFQVIDSWKKQGADKQTLLSNLEKNKAVKNILLKETPWVMEANDEREEKQRLAALFDVNDLQGNCNLWFEKLKDFRRWTDGYSWHKMSYPSIHTTLFVLDNFGRLRKAGIMNDSLLKEAGYSTSLHYLDEQLRAEYEVLKQYHPKEMKEYAYVGMYELYYFQVRSLFPEVKMYDGNKEAFSFYYDLAKDRWMTFPLYGKALAAIAFYRNGDQELAKQVVNSLREFSKTTDEMGMFWPSNTSGCLWSESAISTHTRIMEALELIDPKVQEQDELRLWLLNQKRTQNWGNPIANVDALNVLLLSGTDWLSNDNQVTIKLGGKTLQQDSVEAGTGYFTEYIKGDEVKPSLGHVELKSEAGGNLSWGALYWQFEEDIDKVVKNKTALHVEKMVMLEVQENGKPILKQINEGTKLSVGDKLVVRLTLRTDRDMDYVSLKDQRASCLEPTQQLSGYRCGDGTCYYQSPRDAAMYYFFDHLAKGTYVFEYLLCVTHAGDYCNGITTAQCLYAPEFLTNTGSVRIRVETGK